MRISLVITVSKYGLKTKYSTELELFEFFIYFLQARWSMTTGGHQRKFLET